MYIEVKSTSGEVINDFDMTDNEWEAAKKHGTKYYVFLVNNALKKDAKIFEQIHNPDAYVKENKILLSASMWNLKLNTK